MSSIIISQSAYLKGEKLRMFLHPKEEEAKSRGDAAYTARRGIFGIAQLVFYANGVVHLCGSIVQYCNLGNGVSRGIQN